MLSICINKKKLNDPIKMVVNVEKSTLIVKKLICGVTYQVFRFS